MSLIERLKLGSELKSTVNRHVGLYTVSQKKEATLIEISVHFDYKFILR